MSEIKLDAVTRSIWVKRKRRSKFWQGHWNLAKDLWNRVFKMGAGRPTTGLGGGLTKVYFAKDVATKAFVSTSFAKYTFCRSPQASAVTPRWGNCLRFEMGNIDPRFTPRFTSTVISYIKLAKKWGKNLKQSRSKVPSKMIESWQAWMGVWPIQPQPVWGLSLDNK